MKKARREQWRPYEEGARPNAGEEAEEDEDEADEDLWFYDEERKSIVRRHHVERGFASLPAAREVAQFLSAI